MPSVARTRTIEAAPEKVWRLVSNPHNLPRWWPRVTRVEAVEEGTGGRPTAWTKVYATQAGRGVRADFRTTDFVPERKLAWAQEVQGTPFAKHLSASETVIEVTPSDSATEVTVRSSQSLRGLSKLGGWMMRGAGRRLVDEALDGLEDALTGG